jgi:hypothetical protein
MLAPSMTSSSHAASTPAPVLAPTPAWWRRLTAPWRDLPDHLILGTMKGGTTQLDRLLSTNPGIQKRLWKESRRLTDRNPNARDWRAMYELRWRRQRQERRLGHAIRVGDATPYDLFHPRAPGTALRLVPDARFVVILRDPAYRAWSHHRHAMRHGFETLDFEAAIAAEAERLEGEEARLADDPSATSGPHQHWSYLARGRYAEQLERWFACFPRDRFLVCFTDDLRTRPGALLTDVERHLGLPATPGLKWNPHSPANAGDGTMPSDATRSMLRDHFEPFDEKLANLLGIELPWRGPRGELTGTD